jgi:peptidoglycan/LPS O-acetylase OafA/YrhL
MQTFVGPAWFQRIAHLGYLGVNFFWASPFILVYSSWGRPTRTRDFWQGRFARIYPALVFSLLFMAHFIFACV